MLDQPREPQIPNETFRESFRPALYRWVWGGIFFLFTSAILFTLGLIYNKDDWAKYALGAALMALIFGIVWIVLAYFYRRGLISEGKMIPEHTFFAELFYGISVSNFIPKDIIPKLAERPNPRIATLPKIYVQTLVLDGNVFRIAEPKKAAWDGIVAYFENLPNPSEIIDGISDVRAKLEFFPKGHVIEFLRINNGCWINSHLPTADFPVNKLNCLLLGAFPHKKKETLLRY